MKDITRRDWFRIMGFAGAGVAIGCGGASDVILPDPDDNPDPIDNNPDPDDNGNGGLDILLRNNVAFPDAGSSIRSKGGIYVPLDDSKGIAEIVVTVDGTQYPFAVPEEGPDGNFVVVENEDYNGQRVQVATTVRGTDAGRKYETNSRPQDLEVARTYFNDGLPGDDLVKFDIAEIPEQVFAYVSIDPDFEGYQFIYNELGVTGVGKNGVPDYSDNDAKVFGHEITPAILEGANILRFRNVIGDIKGISITDRSVNYF